MEDTSGFYKNDNGVLLYGKNRVTSSEFDLLREQKDTYTYPVSGWSWFDSEDKARTEFGLPPANMIHQTANLEEVPLWRARAVLKRHGLFDTVNAYIELHKDDLPDLYEVWNYGNFIDRNSMFIQSLGPTFGLTDNQINALFVEALSIEV